MPHPIDGHRDPLDSPGYYQSFGSMTVKPPRIQYVSIKPVSTQTLTGTYSISWVIETHTGYYIRKRWWGAIEETREKSKASKWRRCTSATEWATKHGYSII